MEDYLEGKDIEVDRLKADIRKATLDFHGGERPALTPVLCGSSFKNKGVQPLLDAVLDYLPSPLDVPPVEGLEPAKKGEEEDTPAVREPKDDAPFAALAFKVMSDPFVGKLTYFRVYSGKLEAGGRVLNVSTGRTERAGRILMMHANDREEQQEIYAGDIAAAVGLKQTSTGDTLCAPDAPIKLETIVFPEPVVHVSIEPKTKVDQEKMATALARLAEEDPTFQVRTDEETGQTVISGMGELHLEVIVDRMKREFNVEAGVGRPQVAYRETIRGEAKKVEGKFIRQTGGSGQYGVVYIDLEPCPGEGFDFVNKIKGGSVPSEFIPAVEKGIEEALESGVKAGFPMVDVRATLVDGKYHDTDSSEVAFKIAGSLALKEAAKRAKPVLLEPVMSVEVVTPQEFLGDVIGDLSKRRGRVEGQEPRGNALAVQARVPLGEMFGYATDLRSNTQGRAAYSMQFDRYEEVPPNIAQEITEHRTGEPGRKPHNEYVFPVLHAKERLESGKGEVRARQAARERRHDRAHRPRQDDAYRGDHPGAVREDGWRGEELRRDRQRSRGEGARHHDRHVARRVPDGEPPLRPRRLPGPRRLREEHDHGRRPDGRRDPGGLRRRRPDAADARAHPARPPGRRALHRRLPQQGGHGR